MSGRTALGLLLATALLLPHNAWAKHKAKKSADKNKRTAMELKSSAFSPNGEIPKKHTCQAEDASPMLFWSNVPAGAKSLALICDDPDAPVGTWVHWVIYDIPASLHGLPENVPKKETVLEGAAQGANDFGRIGYGGPCPPPGSFHRYFFKLYALDKTLGLQAGASKAEVLRAMEGRVLAQAELVGRFRR